MHPSPLPALLTCLALPWLAAQTPTVTFTGDTMRMRSAQVTANGSGFAVNLTMEDDNQNSALGSSFRRWWHCGINNFPAAGTTLTVTVSNAGYSDVILPVWATSSDGVQFSSYQRLPTSAVPTQPTSTSHRFSFAVPAGTAAIRLAKYFPYPTSRKTAWVAAQSSSHPRLRSVTTLGYSQQGRAIEMLEFTDSAVPDVGKHRVWIHAGIHPSESTSYFTVEGLVAFLGSGEALAEALLDQTIIDIVPMANPDGVYLGNYRTNANSSNLENEWAAPYNSTQPEIVALRTAIVGFMGTVSSPGSNPIDLLLNLHSSHNVAYPFHFQHTANANWNASTSNSGVLPIVNQLEGQWITRLRQRSAFVNLGATQSSTAGAPTRPFVESMMHDRYSALATWTGAPAFQDPVMAITLEGTYGLAPGGAWNTESDYQGVGAAMGRAMADYFGVQLTASATSYGTSCHGLALNCALVQNGSAHQCNISVAGGPGLGLSAMLFGFQQTATALPAPFACTLWNSADVLQFGSFNALGMTSSSFLLPAAAGLGLSVQGLSLASNGSVDASNAFWVTNNY